MPPKKPLTLAMAIAALGASKAIAMTHTVVTPDALRGTTGQQETGVTVSGQGQAGESSSISREILDELNNTLSQADEDRIIIAGDDEGGGDDDDDDN